MTINFYNAKIKNKDFNKSLGTAIVKSCELKNGSSIEDPVLYMEYSSNLFSCNYVYIPDFNRYYFITGREIVNHTLYITCHVDVLVSFKNDILNSTGTAIRSNFYNKNIPDKMVMPLPGENIQYRKLSSEFTGSNYVFIVGGK